MPTPTLSLRSNSSSVILSPSRSFCDVLSLDPEIKAENEVERDVEDIEWAQLDLKVLNLSSNELLLLEEQIAGFEDLETLDVSSATL